MMLEFELLLVTLPFNYLYTLNQNSIQRCIQVPNTIESKPKTLRVLFLCLYKQKEKSKIHF